MAFVRYTNKTQKPGAKSLENKAENLDSQSQEPIFLISDILGHSVSLEKLAIQLNTLMPDVPIYISHDKRLSIKDPAAIKAQSIKEQAIDLFTAIEPMLATTTKIRLGAYSFGVPVAAELAYLLQDEGYSVDCFFIDGPTVSHSQKYLTSKNAEATRDLIRIFRTSAERAGYQHLVSTEDDTLIRTLKEHNISDQIKQIASLFDILNSEINDERKLVFYRQNKVIATNILSLIKHVPSNFKGRLAICSTEKTCEKYNAKFGRDCDFSLGWKEFNIKGVTGRKQLFGDHQSIVSDYEPLVSLASAMEFWFLGKRSELQPEKKPASPVREDKSASPKRSQSQMITSARALHKRNDSIPSIGGYGSSPDTDGDIDMVAGNQTSSSDDESSNGSSPPSAGLQIEFKHTASPEHSPAPLSPELPKKDSDGDDIMNSSQDSNTSVSSQESISSSSSYRYGSMFASAKRSTRGDSHRKHKILQSGAGVTSSTHGYSTPRAGS